MANSKIKLTKNGPLKISGDFELEDEQEKVIQISGDNYLCRCGNSSDKPFCDGTHAVLHFDSSKGIQEYSE
jgi:CDGSH-type Zn-finger protein